MAGWNPVGTTVATDRRGAESWNKVDDSLKAAVFTCFRLGGSRGQSVVGTGYKDAADYWDFEIPDAASAGATYHVDVELLCENASTSITPKIYNVTDAADAVVGSAATSTSWAAQTLSFTPAASKKYRLMFSKSDDLHKCFGIGILRRANA